MSLEFTDGDGAQALDRQQEIDRWQFSVIEGCEVSPGTQDMTVQVDAGSVFFDGDIVDAAAQDNVQLAAADSTYPRKDVVYLDANGDLQVETGTPEAAVPADSTRFQTRRPAPSDLSGMDATVLAEVWVAAGGEDISAGDVRDRRVFAEISTGSVRLADQDAAPTPAAGGRVVYARADGQVYKVNPDGSEDPIGSGGAFEDTDDDGVAELQQDHADFQGGDARNVGALSTGEARITGTADIQVDVPSDYATLADAMQAATEIVESREDVEVAVNIETGHAIETNLFLEYGNWGYITITSEDATVSVSGDFPADANVMWVNNGIAPKWDVHADAQNNGSGGLSYRNAIATITPGSGVINSGEDGLIANTSTVYAYNTDFSGAANDGMDAMVTAVVQAQSADFSGAGNRGCYIARSSNVAMANAVATNATNQGLEIRRSRVHCDDVDVSGAGDHGVNAINGSHVTGGDVIADNVGNNGANARDGTVLELLRFSTDGADNDGVKIGEGCRGSIRNASISNTTRYGLHGEGAVQVDATDTSLSSIGGSLAVAGGSAGSLITLTGVTLDGRTIAAGDTNYGSFNAVESTGIAFQ